MKKTKEQEEHVSLEIGDYTVIVNVTFTTKDDEKMWHSYELIGVECPEAIDIRETDITEDMLQTEIASHYQYLAENPVEPPLEALAFVIQASEDNPAGVSFSESGNEAIKRVKDWFVEQGGVLFPKIRR
jgi:hypothetical protein